MYEIPAGRLDPGEDPLALRRPRAPRGDRLHRAERCEFLFTMFTTPGFTDERIHLFMATGLERGETAHEADEFMTVETVTLSERPPVIKGEITDGKTALGDPLRRWVSRRPLSAGTAREQPHRRPRCVKTETSLRPPVSPYRRVLRTATPLACPESASARLSYFYNVLTTWFRSRLTGHTVCFSVVRGSGLRREDQIESVLSEWVVPFQQCQGGTDYMAEVAIKRALLPGAATREKLRAQDDAAVVAAFLGGEERAFQELVERYQTRLLNFIYRTIGDREKAEDLVQEVFIRVYRHLHRFDRTKKFSTWVYTIASNLAKNELRNRSRNPLVLFQTIKGNWEDEDRPLQFEDTTARPDDLYRKRHLRELVEETVAKLPEHHRQVFVLRELEGKSYEEIAEITDCNLGTVKSRLNRARNAFASIIEPKID